MPSGDILMGDIDPVYDRERMICREGGVYKGKLNCSGSLVMQKMAINHCSQQTSLSSVTHYITGHG